MVTSGNANSANRRTSRSGSSGALAQPTSKRQSVPREGAAPSSRSGTPTTSIAADKDTMPNAMEFRPRRHSSQQVSKEEAAAIISGHDISGSATTTIILINIFRAFLARALFIVHSITTIWVTINLREDQSIWTFALISVSIVVEGCYAIVMRAGDERKWFSPSVLLYILATAPPIWLLETKLCEFRKLKGDGAPFDDKIQLQLLEQLLLVMLIVGRWLLPKGEISREQLSQILLAYLAISSDIVEFFDVFKERVVYQNQFIQYIVLSAWTLSLLQFAFILTTSRARKMRVAITNEDATLLKKRSDIWQAFYDIDIWAIILANSLQDVPFFAVRLYLMAYHGLITYTMIFFICKNALIIVLQTYRGFVLFNDRYIHPKLEFRARALIEEQNRRMSVSNTLQPCRQKKKSHQQTQQRKSLTPRERIAVEQPLRHSISITSQALLEHPVTSSSLPQPHQQQIAVYQIDELGDRRDSLTLFR